MIPNVIQIQYKTLLRIQHYNPMQATQETFYSQFPTTIYVVMMSYQTASAKLTYLMFRMIRPIWNSKFNCVQRYQRSHLAGICSSMNFDVSSFTVSVAFISVLPQQIIRPDLGSINTHTHTCAHTHTVRCASQRIFTSPTFALTQDVAMHENSKSWNVKSRHPHDHEERDEILVSRDCEITKTHKHAVTMKGLAVCIS